MLFSPKTALRLTALFLIPCLVLDPALAAGSSLFNRAASRAVSDGKSVSRLQIDAFTTPLAIAPLHDVLHPIPVEGVGRFEHEMLRTVRDQHANILEEIRAAKELKPETEKTLVEALDKFAKAFTV